MYQIQTLDFPENLPLEEEVLVSITDSLLATTGLKQSGFVNIAIIDDARMQELNKLYRGIDSNTDVLSFHYFDINSDVPAEEVFGEILFSLSKIEDQAKTFGHTPTEEVYRLLTHGLLHLQGFDHETEEDYEIMWEHEQYILQVLQKDFGILELGL